MARSFFPTGQVTLGGSVLVEADKYSQKNDNSLTLKATLANKNGTPVTGMRSVEVSWEMYITNEAPEIDMLNAVDEARPMLLGFKFPNLGVSTSINATAASATVGQSLGEVCVVQCTAKGSMNDSQGI